jgi:hypothetical protein
MEMQIGKLKHELAEVRNEAVLAHINGNKPKADCLTGKAVGMKSALELAERAVREKDTTAIGELEGMERVIDALSPLPKCVNGKNGKNHN